MKGEFYGEPRNKMRVLQLIDSLRPGGAEKMAVTYANALAKRIDRSFLCCTRTEGLLKKQISPEVGYLFLTKKSTLDLQAFLKLRKFVKANKIDLIQVHSSSWFLALMIKLSLPKIQLIWHDHYGRDLPRRKARILKYASRYFDGIIAVNKDLEAWSRKNLYCKKVRYIRNFLPEGSSSEEKVELKGGDSFKIICVANFRPQKDHLNLLRAFLILNEEHPELSLHLVGKEEKNDYAKLVREFIERNNLSEKIFFYGEQENIRSFLEQGDLGVLSSSSEGLPVALLEYGRFGLPVVCTDVGECSKVIGSVGKLVPPNNPEALAEAIGSYFKNDTERIIDAASFQEKVVSAFSEEAVMPDLVQFYERILK